MLSILARRSRTTNAASTNTWVFHLELATPVQSDIGDDWLKYKNKINNN